MTAPKSPDQIIKRIDLTAKNSHYGCRLRLDYREKMIEECQRLQCTQGVLLELLFEANYRLDMVTADDVFEYDPEQRRVDLGGFPQTRTRDIHAYIDRYIDKLASQKEGERSTPDCPPDVQRINYRCSIRTDYAHDYAGFLCEKLECSGGVLMELLLASQFAKGVVTRADVLEYGEDRDKIDLRFIQKRSSFNSS